MIHRPFFNFKLSLQKIILLFILCGILPLNILLIVSNIYTTLLNYEHTKSSYENILEHESANLSDCLNTVSALIGRQYTQSIQVRQMQENTDKDSLYHNSYRFISTLAPYMETLSWHYTIFIFKQPSGLYNAEQSSDLTTQQRTLASDLLHNFSQGTMPPVLGKWTILTNQSQSLLSFIIGQKDVYAGIFLFTEPILTDSSSLISSPCLISDGSCLVSADTVIRADTFTQPDYSKYLMLKNEIPDTGLSLLTFLSKHFIYSQMHLQYKVLLVLSLLSIGIIPLTVICLKKFVFCPLKKLKHTIQLIQTDITDIRLPQSAFLEMNEIYDVFNHFMTRIYDLKIQQYESWLKQQEYHLQYLQLQLKPHFYLNALKFIYALAVSGDTDTIMQYLICLSEYFEYIVYHADSLVTVEEELRHAQNYLEMQKIRQSHDIFCKLDIDNTLTTQKLPTLSIQTFIENSIKYAVNGDCPLIIHIRVKKIGHGHDTYLYIQIRDNGPGYCADVLEQFCQDNTELFKNRHVGLGNLLQRLELLYDNRAYMNISNGFNGGALSEIYIPLSGGESFAERINFR